MMFILMLAGDTREWRQGETNGKCLGLLAKEKQIEKCGEVLGS